MKKPKKITLKEQLKLVRECNEGNIGEIMFLRSKIEELRLDNVWLKQLTQEMLSTMNAGAKEGSFPRRN